MIGVAGQSKPRLLSRSSRPAAAAFRVDQDARWCWDVRIWHFSDLAR